VACGAGVALAGVRVAPADDGVAPAGALGVGLAGRGEGDTVPAEAPGVVVEEGAFSSPPHAASNESAANASQGTSRKRRAVIACHQLSCLPQTDTDETQISRLTEPVLGNLCMSVSICG
jgi:hypothetical protein